MCAITDAWAVEASNRPTDTGRANVRFFGLTISANGVVILDSRDLVGSPSSSTKIRVSSSTSRLRRHGLVFGLDKPAQAFGRDLWQTLSAFEGCYGPRFSDDATYCAVSTVPVYVENSSTVDPSIATQVRHPVANAPVSMFKRLLRMSGA